MDNTHATVKGLTEGVVTLPFGYFIAQVSGIINPIMGAALIGFLGLMIRIYFEWRMTRRKESSIVADNILLRAELEKIQNELGVYKELVSTRNTANQLQAVVDSGVTTTNITHL